MAARIILQSDPKYGVVNTAPYDETNLDPAWGYVTLTETFSDTAYNNCVKSRPMPQFQPSVMEMTTQMQMPFDFFNRLSGGTERWAIVGRTLDQSSNAVANMTVLCVDAGNGVVTDTTTSDQSGFFSVGNVYGAGRGQAVAQRTGSPDLAGASDNNLP